MHAHVKKTIIKYSWIERPNIGKIEYAGLRNCVYAKEYITVWKIICVWSSGRSNRNIVKNHYHYMQYFSVSSNAFYTFRSYLWPIGDRNSFDPIQIQTNAYTQALLQLAIFLFLLICIELNSCLTITFSIHQCIVQPECEMK